MTREKLILANKYIGETPLEALERVREERNIPEEIPMTYAGRLDPMAEGLLLVLIGGECKNKDAYLGLQKEYEVSVLLGFETDTGDLLGRITNHRFGVDMEKLKITEVLKGLEGKHVQEYPAFSSKTVDGVALFALAKANALPEKFPSKEVEIKEIELLAIESISSNDLLNYIVENIAKVKGDFRQTEVLEGWQSVLSGTHQSFPCYKNKGEGDKRHIYEAFGGQSRRGA